ncbi:peptidyl-prolyl cis-trans isomerase B (cyclophilin B) [Krasilnikovia cinnamomea]|uniref:Peptidyl-prolyl cis-trans isomerase B (Cyclophilin B) n=1 Tax=Krasilnikovia cinnamomea TaxID=349313 RepID=A0A4Q7ZG54_9ACTN|nr:peptidylprolyl isomerase [Krasilnikovia cinnamomea]RZU48999.1 peptidyl-prolyl cis-trans isomerase B (cyclophilin B) [Krasilnikovia cinnamomea]
MASSKDRQRKLARAKLDRQQARRASKLQRRRRIQAGVGAALGLLLIVGGVAWLGGAFDSDDTDAPDASASDVCAWTPQSATTNTSLKEVGTPPTKGIPTSGPQTMTITTNKGKPIVVSMDTATTPCSAASFNYLAGKKFFDNTECHELTTDGAVRCGDPTGTGQGGPTYSFYDENLPTAPPTPAPSPSVKTPPKIAPLYPRGTVAMIGNPPGSNGSQFLIFFKDFSPKTPQYSIVGRVTDGLDTVAAIGRIPVVDNGSGAKVKPKDKIVVQSVTVSAATGATPAPSTSSQS